MHRCFHRLWHYESLMPIRNWNCTGSMNVEGNCEELQTRPTKLNPGSRLRDPQISLRIVVREETMWSKKHLSPVMNLARCSIKSLFAASSFETMNSLILALFLTAELSIWTCPFIILAEQTSAILIFACWFCANVVPIYYQLVRNRTNTRSWFLVPG